MKLTLGRKLFLYTAATLIAVLFVTFLVLERTQARQWEGYLQEQSVAFARFATPEVLKLFRGEFAAPADVKLGALADFLGLNRDLVRIEIVSGSGRSLYRSPLFHGYENLRIPEELEQVDVQRLAQPGTSSRVLYLAGGRRLLDLLSPAYGPTGTLVLSIRYLISYDSVDQRLEEMRGRFLMVAVFTTLLSIVLAAVLVRKVSRPLLSLTDGVRAIGQGELETRLQIGGHDEIAALGNAFNEMVDSLARHRQALTEKNDALQAANAELKQVQDQLLRSERLAAIGQLAAGVSHEIDNPVGIILGYAELLLEDLAGDDPRRDDVLAIIDECRRCRRITGGLLGLARTAPEERIEVDLPGLVDNVFVSLRPQKLFRGIRLQLQADTELPTIPGDIDRLRQVLVNLLLNAGQALDGQGNIVVSLFAREQEVCLRVADDGPGVPEELRERIFEPFVSSKPKEQGTGLGLPLCRKLVEDHGGRLDLEESASGASFLLVLPRAEAGKML